MTRRGFSSRIAEHIRTPLYRASYALVLSAAGTAVLGIGYWAVATRTYSAHEVGVQSVVVSTMLFLSGLSQLSLNSVLIRFLPVSGRRSGPLIGGAYAASVAAAVAVATVFVVGTPLWAPTLSFLRRDPIWFGAFVASTAAWCVFSLQDSALAGLRRTTWVPIENIGVSAFKIVLLVALQSRLAHAGVFASWAVPAALAAVIVNVLIFSIIVPPLQNTDAAEHHPLRAIVRFAGGNYVGFVFFAASSNLLPLIVLNRTGATTAAYFFLPWAIISALFLVAASTATSLTVEAVRDIAELGSYYRRTLVHTFALLAGPVALLCLGAPTLLRLFGSGYAEHGATGLRLLSLGVLPNALVLIGLGVLRIRGRVVRLAGIQALVAVLLLGGSYVLLPRYGITGVGIAFDLSQVAAATLLLLGDLRPIVRLGAKPRS